MKFTALAAAMVMTLGLSACAGGGGTKSSSGGMPEELVAARAQARWELLIAGKFDEAWEYFTPGYRSAHPREIWSANMKGRPVHWLAARAGEVSCQPEEAYCDITISVDISTRMPIAAVGEVKATAPVPERWLSLDGEWYFVPKDVASPN